MNVNLKIDSLMLETEGARRFDVVSLKAAVERHLGLMIAANGLPAMSSGALKTVGSPGDVAIDTAGGETRLARELARRIYQGMTR